MTDPKRGTDGTKLTHCVEECVRSGVRRELCILFCTELYNSEGGGS